MNSLKQSTQTLAICFVFASTCLALSGCGQQTASGGEQAFRNALVTGTLSCDPVDEWPSFEKPVGLLIDGDKITTEDLGVEPAAERFETWSGQIEDGRISLSGRYKHPDQRSPRPVKLTGGYANGQIRLEGTRGPRKCTYASTHIEAQE